MRLNQSFEAVPSEDDAICITAHEGHDGPVSFHGYGMEGGYNCWCVKFLPCQKHIEAIQKLLVTLEELKAKKENA